MSLNPTPAPAREWTLPAGAGLAALETTVLISVIAFGSYRAGPGALEETLSVGCIVLPAAAATLFPAPKLPPS